MISGGSGGNGEGGKSFADASSSGVGGSDAGCKLEPTPGACGTCCYQHHESGGNPFGLYASMCANCPNCSAPPTTDACVECYKKALMNECKGSPSIQECVSETPDCTAYMDCLATCN
jgi:hypothetical protein